MLSFLKSLCCKPKPQTNIPVFKMVSDISNLEIVKCSDLKAGDTIIYSNKIFKIDECGQGVGAGNEFGEYFSMTGRFSYGISDSSTQVTNWGYRNCPVIRLLEDKQ
jgi:hypothetical protein